MQYLKPRPQRRPSELFDWEGNRLWDYVYSNDNHHQHHDIEPLPNGNVLILAWERKSKEEAIAAGRNPDTVSDRGMFPDTVVEVKRKGQPPAILFGNGALGITTVQDHDPSKANYGDVSAHPERLDINLNPRPRPDWMHTNAIDYNPELDQIILSPRSFHELIVIDHGTTTQEAASSSGENPAAVAIFSIAGETLPTIEPGPRLTNNFSLNTIRVGYKLGNQERGT